MGFFIPWHITFGIPAGIEVELSWDDDTGDGIRLADAAAGSWLCLSVERAEECGRSVTPGAEHLDPLFDWIAESLQRGTARYEPWSRIARPSP